MSNFLVICDYVEMVSHNILSDSFLLNFSMYSYFQDYVIIVCTYNALILQDCLQSLANKLSL